MTKALQYIEIDFDHCSLTYGTLPCTASLTNSPPTGTHKCFNTLSTCQDRVNFTQEDFTLRFAVPTEYLPVEIDAIPSIKSITFDSATVSLGENIGQRASITVTFEDHRHSDTGGLDKYLADRTYNPFTQGTFFGKFRARVPFLRGRALRWINGSLGQSLSEMETRYYVIESYTGPTANGEYIIIAKDVLKLADGDRAQAPMLTAGFLQSDITNVATVITLAPSGSANNYTRSGWVAIGGSEIAAYLQQKGYDDDGSAPNAVTFDGTNDSLARGSVLTGVADGKSATISFWIRRNSSANQRIYTDRGNFFGVVPRFAIEMTSTILRVFGQASGGTTVVLDISVPVPALSLWTNVLISFDLTNTSNRHVYLNDVAQTITVTTYTNTNINFNGDETFIGITENTTNRLNSDLADFWLEHNLYTDFSVEANRRKYISADIQPIKLGPTGQTPTGSSPDVYLANAPASWHTNLGTGGGFTLTGTLSSASFSGDQLLLTARGQLGTSASAHSAQDRVQQVLRYEAESPADIIADLLENYAGVPTAYIPLATWQLECDTYLAQLYTATIAQPTAVVDLVNEMIEQAGLALWWNDRDQEIGLQVLRGAAAMFQEVTEDNTVAGSLEISEQPDKRLSQIHTYYGQINPLTSLTDKSNFRSVESTIDSDAESDYGSAAIKEIFSRWMPSGARSIATRLNSILLARYVDPPRRFKFQVMRGSVNELVLAGVYNLTAWPLQDDQGASDPTAIQLIRQRPMADLIELEGEEMLFNAPAVDLSNRVVTFAFNTLNVNGRSAHDALYPAASSGDHVTFLISANVIVGSNSMTTPAFDVGSWPAGVSITVEIIGRIQGRGGKGGDYGVTGENGGTALFTRKAITLIYTDGEIWSGGGGGGSTLSGVADTYAGGGGAGYLPGAGGIATIGTPSNGNPGTTEAGGAATLFGPAGGDPGLPGGNGNISNGGSAGTAIDGNSFITVSGAAGDRRGAAIN